MIGVINLFKAELLAISAGIKRELIDRGDVAYLVDCKNDDATCLLRDEMVFASKANDADYSALITWFCKTYGIKFSPVSV
jgi:hypothetical protein